MASSSFVNSKVRVAIVGKSLDEYTFTMVDESKIGEALRAFFGCDDIDYEDLSLAHTFYYGTGDNNQRLGWKVLVRSNDDGSRLVDVTEHDVRQLPCIIRENEEKRAAFSALLDTHTDV